VVELAVVFTGRIVKSWVYGRRHAGSQSRTLEYKNRGVHVITRNAIRSILTSVYFIVGISAVLFSVDAVAQIEEIVVTVRKKAENTQDIPISLDVFTSETIDRKGINNIADVARLTPSLQFDESFAQSDTRIVVRGLSPTRGRQNVALLLDGIDVSSEAISSSGGSLLLNTRLVDIERIDVVLGPQMALYGRSAFNGAIQYITKDPSEVLETEVKVDVADYNRYNVTGSVSGPIFGDALGVRVNGAWWDEGGFYENSITNKRVGGDKGYGLGLTFKSEIGDNVSLKFRGEYTDDEGQPTAAAFLPFNTELATPLEATELLPGGAGIAECFDGQNGQANFIGAISNASTLNPPEALFNDENLQARTDRISDPNFVSMTPGSDLNQYLVANNLGPLPGATDPTVPTGGVSPYCEWVVPVRVGEIPDADQLTVALAPNPATPGQDYPGFQRELLRLSLVASVDIDAFTFTSLTGLTRDDTFEAQDAGTFAYLSADAGPFLDGNVNTFSANNIKTTEQFSQEFRFATKLDGPVNGIFGINYWEEQVDNGSVSITAESSGSHCFWNSAQGTINPIGIQDGCTGYTDTPVAPYQYGATPFRDPNPSDRDTEHWSVYGTLDFEIAESWRLTTEGRYNQEDVTVFGPVFLDPGASGGPGGLNPCGIFFRECEPFEDWVDGGNWFADAYFPYIDEDADGTAFNEFRVDDALLAQIPGECVNSLQGQNANSIADGPFEIEREVNSIGQNVPKWNDGSTVTVLDANGRAVVNPVGTDVFNPWCKGSLTDSDSWFSPKITMDWQPTDNSMYYVSWSKAHKPGGFSLLTVGSSGLSRDVTEFEPEKMQVWEVGGKTDWLENSLIINGSLFFQDFTDKQALTSALGNDGRLVSKVENAGSAEVWGAELSIAWSSPNEILGGLLSISGAYTWLDTEYTDFTVISGSSVNAAAAGNCTPTLVGENLLCSLSYTGNELEDAPAGAFNGYINYTFPMAEGTDFFVESDVVWQDKRFAGVTNNLWMQAFWNFDLRAGFQTEKWEALLYVNNVLDNNTVQMSGGGPGLSCCFVLGSGLDLTDPPVPTSAVMVDLPLFSTAFLPPPRLVGFRMAVRFGGGS
jgi:outer membrane receptor protein involved in Fe transport